MTPDLHPDPAILSYRRLLVFARVPRKGEGMPLVSARLGEAEAYRLQLLLLARTHEQCSLVPAEHWVFFPEDPLPLPAPGWRVFPQGNGDIRARLEQAFALAFEDGARSVVAVDVECPWLTAALMEHAFRVLEGEGMGIVLGPSERGGYYLLGSSEPRPELFRAMPFGSSRLFRTTFDRALAAGVATEVLPRLGNIETVEDWRRAADEGWLLGPERKTFPR